MRRLSVLASSMVLIAGSAAAAVPGMQFERTIQFSPERTRQIMLDFANCQVQVQKPLARQVLSLPLSSEEQGALLVKKFNGEQGCLPGAYHVHFTGALPMVGALATAFIGSEYARYDLVAEVNNAPPVVPLDGREAFALCFVRRSPDVAVQLVRARIGSTAESDALAGLAPAITACGNLHAQETALGDVERALTALVLYRYAVQAEGRAPKS